MTTEEEPKARNEEGKEQESKSKAPFQNPDGTFNWESNEAAESVKNITKLTKNQY